MNVRRYAHRRSAFTLIEALLAISIMAIAGGAIMLGLTSSIQTTQVSVESTIAQGLARQRIDEVLGGRYAAPGSGPYQFPLGPSNYEQSGQGRERFNDTDDYHGFTAKPVEGVHGLAMGLGDDAGNLRHANFQISANYFSNWSESIEVYYVDETDPSIRLTGSNTSNFRAVEVQIVRTNPDGTQSELASLRRVYAYVPSPQ